MKTTKKEHTLFFSTDYNLEFLSLKESITDSEILNTLNDTLEGVNGEIDFNLILTASMGVKFINSSLQTVITIHGSSADTTITLEKWKEAVIYFSKKFYLKLKKDSEDLGIPFSQKYTKVHFRESETYKLEVDFTN